jgi:arginyl-tRNA synthetase
MNFKEEVVKILEVSIKEIKKEEIVNTLEVPPNANMGDFSFPCFKIAKILKKSPQIIAKEIGENLQTTNWLSKIEVTGAYINFFITNNVFSKQTLTKVLTNKENYGKSEIGNKAKIVIDYSSPNIAKPFHVGHLRSTSIGNALYNIFNYTGYESVGVNHLGDWGTQFGKLIVAYKLWGKDELIKQDGITELTRIYVKFHDEAKINPALEDEARAWLIKMQNGDDEALKLWQWFKDISIIEFNRIYAMLDIQFDSWKGESFYTDKMDAVVKELKDKDIMKESKGAMVVDLEEYKMPPCLILRSDGGTLYPTRDITAAIYRQERYKFEKCLYVTALDQSLHFEQWFKVIHIMKKDWAKGLVHIPFGLVSVEEGKLSTRGGNIILMEDLLNQAIEKTKEIIEAKNPQLKNKEEVAKQVGIGAVIFNDLYNQRIKDVTFTWEKILNFEGETGPYVQYTHARACSILTKGNIKNIDINNINFELITDAESMGVVKCIEKYGDKIIEAGNKYEPYILSRYLIDLSQNFNKFYNENPILSSEDEVKLARLAIVMSVQCILESGLKLLGIKAPIEM